MRSDPPRKRRAIAKVSQKMQMASLNSQFANRRKAPRARCRGDGDCREALIT